MQLTCYLKNQAALPSNKLSLSNKPHFRKLLQNLSLNMRLAWVVLPKDKEHTEQYIGVKET